MPFPISEKYSIKRIDIPQNHIECPFPKICNAIQLASDASSLFPLIPDEKYAGVSDNNSGKVAIRWWRRGYHRFLSRKGQSTVSASVAVSSHHSRLFPQGNGLQYKPIAYICFSLSLADVLIKSIAPESCELRRYGCDDFYRTYIAFFQFVPTLFCLLWSRQQNFFFKLFQ